MTPPDRPPLARCRSGCPPPRTRTCWSTTWPSALFLTRVAMLSAMVAFITVDISRRGGTGAPGDRPSSLGVVAAFTTPAYRTTLRSTKSTAKTTTNPPGGTSRAINILRHSTALSSPPQDKQVSSSSSTKTTRPLEQNWWPVSLVSAVDPESPNPVEILDKRLVLWHDGNTWNCLDDACAHRFAPLSEGRVQPPTGDNGGKEQKKSGAKRCLQCAYHGWEFNSTGGCQHIPQSTSPLSDSKIRSVADYPVTEGAGMIWVWPDRTSTPDDVTSLPISPLLRRYTEVYPQLGFQRDLPYGYEILGENLLDLSHLPFSHHGLMTLNRELGGPLPFRPLNADERQSVHENEKHTGYCTSEELEWGQPALIQGEIVDAHLYDPVMKPQYDKGFLESAVTYCGFYHPSHVRYRRLSQPSGGEGHTELFLCPTTAGKSRVFLFNVFTAILPPSAKVAQEPAAESKEPSSSTEKNNDSMKKPGLVRRIFLNILRKRMKTYRGHMISHQIFDGDGIFLHKQGDRMARNSLGYRDYYTPSSADVLVNSFRRYVDAAGRKSVDCGHAAVAYAATGGAIGAAELGREGLQVYRDDLPRNVMLDRYNTHTKSCPLCSSALTKLERKRDVSKTLGTAFVGAAGTSMAAGIIGLVLGNPGLRLAKTSVALLLASMGASAWNARVGRKLAENIAHFYFVDYVHQEKN